jgi:hypothetical protein
MTQRPSVLFTPLEHLARVNGFGDVLDARDNLHLIR